MPAPNISDKMFVRSKRERTSLEKMPLLTAHCRKLMRLFLKGCIWFKFHSLYKQNYRLMKLKEVKQYFGKWSLELQSQIQSVLNCRLLSRSPSFDKNNDQ